MIKRQELVDEARTWIGTPWIHQGRFKGISCDCVGFIVMVPRALGIFPPDFDFKIYSRIPNPKILHENLVKHLDRVDYSDRRIGNVLLIVPRRLPQHVAMLTGKNTIIHAIDLQRGVREHRLDETYKIASVWTYRGLSD